MHRSISGSADQSHVLPREGKEELGFRRIGNGQVCRVRSKDRADLQNAIKNGRSFDRQRFDG